VSRNVVGNLSFRQEKLGCSIVVGTGVAAESEAWLRIELGFAPVFSD
jgi:hypothetical protein